MQKNYHTTTTKHIGSMIQYPWIFSQVFPKTMFSF